MVNVAYKYPGVIDNIIADLPVQQLLIQPFILHLAPGNMKPTPFAP